MARILLAVLPFDNLSGDPEQEYLSDGMTEEMIAHLGRLHPARLGVIGRTSAMHYKETTKRADEIGRELGVDYILTGSVRRSAARLRVSAGLVRAEDQVQIWSGDYDRDLKDAIDLQSEVARAIAAEVPLRLTPQDRDRSAGSRPIEPEAYESYLQGRYFWSKITVEAERKAIEHLEKAVAADPGYGPAWAWLGSAITLSAHLGGIPPKQAMVRARAALDRALTLDPTSADAHSHDGWLKLTYEWDFQAAAQAFRRALALNPSLANAQQGYSLYLAAVGRTAESVAEMRKARELDPLSPIVRADLCLTLYHARRYDEATEQCRQTLEMDPASVPGHLFLMRVYEVAGQHDQAMEQRIQLGHVMFPGEAWFEEWSATLGAAYRSSGWAAARTLLIERQASSQWPEQQAYSIARDYALLGDEQNALDWLERAYEWRRFHMAFLKVDPQFDVMRREPRFEELLRRIGLPP